MLDILSYAFHAVLFLVAPLFLCYQIFREGLTGPLTKQFCICVAALILIFVYGTSFKVFIYDERKYYSEVCDIGAMNNYVFRLQDLQIKAHELETRLKVLHELRTELLPNSDAFVPNETLVPKE